MPTRSTTVETWNNGQLVDTETITYEVSQEQDNHDTISAAAAQALATNRVFLALASPTAGQVTAEVKALARQQNGIIRLLLNQLDGTD